MTSFSVCQRHEHSAIDDGLCKLRSGPAYIQYIRKKTSISKKGCIVIETFFFFFSYHNGFSRTTKREWIVNTNMVHKKKQRLLYTSYKRCQKKCEHITHRQKNSIKFFLWLSHYYSELMVGFILLFVIFRVFLSLLNHVIKNVKTIIKSFPRYSTGRLNVIEMSRTKFVQS